MPKLWKISLVSTLIELNALIWSTLYVKHKTLFYFKLELVCKVRNTSIIIKIGMLDWDLCANIKVAQLYCWPSEKTIISLAKLAKLLSIDRQLAHYHFVPHYHFSPSTIFFPNYHFITPLPFYHPATHYHGTLWTNHIHKS